MKTEKQVVERLEQLTEKLEALCNHKTPPAEWEQKAQEMILECTVLVALINQVAWILDMEEQMRPILAMLDVAAIADKFRVK